MKKLIKKFIVWAMRDNDDNRVDDDVPMAIGANRPRRRNQVTASDQGLRSNGMTFFVYAAEGGTVIETSFYNDKEDRNDNRLYIIPDGEDFTSTLGQIVSMERIKSWH